MKKIILLLFYALFLCFGLLQCGSADKAMGRTKFSKVLKINNVSPRLDTAGNIVDVHDGRVIKFGDRYYWYGTTYGTTNGFTTGNHYQVYSSADLKNWKKEGRLLPDQPEGVYYRPHVIYNQKTKKYVLWYNWYPQLWDGQFGVAVSDYPQGPFKIVNDNVQVFNSKIGVGDFGLFVDDDQTAYLSYNTIKGHEVSVEKLTADYTESTMENGGIIAQHMEAGTMFKHNAKYYLLTDYTCCFCNYGSGARVYMSDHPLRGFVYTGNINRHPGRTAELLTDGKSRGNAFAHLKKKDKGFDVIELLFAKANALTSIQLHLFTGNRPENCGDVSNPRVHPPITTPDFDIFEYKMGKWEQINLATTTVEKSALSEAITLTFPATTSTTRIKIKPKDNYPFDHIYPTEINVSNKNNQLFTKKEVKSYITGFEIPDYPIIPAQQTYVMDIDTPEGKAFIWMGDLWGSASDSQKGHDYQYWSAPLEFYPDGTIKQLEWVDEWNITTLK